mgnify:CR=1 FL=1
MVAYEKQTMLQLREKGRLLGLNKKVDNFWKLKKVDLIILLRNPPKKNKSDTIATRQRSDVTAMGVRKSKR